MSNWDEDVLENHSYWDIDILEEYRQKKEKEIQNLSTTIWSRLWNWRKIRKIKTELDELHYV
jgi:hypothetical protein